MFRKNTIKCFAFLFLSLCMAFSFKTDACESAAITGETSLAGMTVYLDRFYSASVKKKTYDRKEQVKAKKNNRKKIIKKSNIYDTLANAGFKYENLGVANVSGALNVHREASESSAVVGKMTKDNGCDIKGTKGKWSHIVSGKVNGYVLSKYLLTGDKAKSRAKSVARLRAIVNTKTLNVRTLPSIDSKICDTLSQEEEYTVGNSDIKKEWLQKYIKKNLNKTFGKKQLKSVNKKAMYQDLNNWIMLSIDEQDVFINKDFLEFNYDLSKAVTYSSSDTSSGQNNGSSGKGSIYSKLVAYAMKFLGNKYVWGGTSLTNGTDCSGFTMRIYEHFGYKIPRVSRSQAAFTKTVKASDVKVGDLFFYGNNGYISHVAMYIGNGQIIHASNHRDGIKISNAYYRKPIKIGRVIN